MSANKHGAIGVIDVESGRLTVCASADPGGAYHTLCGISLNDDQFEPYGIADETLINCKDCRAIWDICRTFNRRDFTRGKR